MAALGRLANKVAVVTGAAGGIGAACVAALLREGSVAVATDVRPPRGDQWQLDVTDEDQWRAVIDRVVTRHGRLDILVNNAGLGNHATMIQDMELDDWRRIFAVNVEGTFLGMKHAIPAMTKNGGGSIINISSAGGIVGTPGMSAYCGSKAAVRLMSKCAALEAGKLNNGVRVNSIHPGFVQTDTAMDIVTNSFGIDPREAIHMMSGMSAVGRVGTPQDIAEAVVYLASDEAGYVTGTELILDGGLTAQ